METKTLETLLVDATDTGVVTVTMNRPEKKNAANGTMWDELREVYDEFTEGLDTHHLAVARHALATTTPPD